MAYICCGQLGRLLAPPNYGIPENESLREKEKWRKTEYEESRKFQFAPQQITVVKNIQRLASWVL